MEELLPIGSVVILNNNRRGMIIGYLPSKPGDEVIYDYVCCNSKIGIHHKWDDIEVGKDVFYILKKDIKRVLYIGYSNEEFDSFSTYYSKIDKKIKQLNMKDISQEELQKVYTSIFNEIINSGSDQNEK